MVQRLSESVQAAEIKLTGEKGSLVKYGVGNIGTSDSGRGNLTNNITGGHIGSYTVEMVAGDNRNTRNMEFMEAWEQETKLMSGVENFVIFESPTGGPPGRDLDIRIISDDLTTMKKAALALRQELRLLPGLIAVSYTHLRAHET